MLMNSRAPAKAVMVSNTSFDHGLGSRGNQRGIVTPRTIARCQRNRMSKFATLWPTTVGMRFPTDRKLAR
ncbi:Uncharacterised protein [Mycobacterium tuberculosis]|nr:Uncharacterised protein [Mycobacterium tuberculosis]